VIEHNLDVIRAPTGSSTWAPRAATPAASWCARHAGGCEGASHLHTGKALREYDTALGISLTAEEGRPLQLVRQGPAGCGQAGGGQ
jgi:hypothetical protein